MGIDQVSEGDRHLFFDVTRLVHVAGNAEQLGAGIVRTTETGKPTRAATKNGWNHRNRFDIVHRRRTAIQTRIGREWWLQAWLAFLALKAFQQGRFLAADISASAVMDIEIGIPAVHIVFADQFGFISLFDRFLERFPFSNIFAAQVHVTGMGAHRATGDHAALNQ